MAAPAARRGVDLLAGGRVTLAAPATSVGAAAGLGRDGALYGLGLGGGLVSAAAAGRHEEREYEEGEDEDARHRRESIPAAAAT